MSTGDFEPSGGGSGDFEPRPAPDGVSTDRAVAFLFDQWDELWKTKASVEQRGITLITTSGVLVTLTFGFAATVTKGHHFGTFSHPEKVVLAVALGLFALSAAMGLRVNVPTSWNVPDFFNRSAYADVVEPWVFEHHQRHHPEEPLPDLMGVVEGNLPTLRLQSLETAIEANTVKVDHMAEWLALAFLVQIFAIATLAIDVGIVIG